MLRVENVLRIERLVKLERSSMVFVKVDALEPSSVDRFEVVLPRSVDRFKVALLSPVNSEVVLVRK